MLQAITSPRFVAWLGALACLLVFIGATKRAGR